MGCNDHQSWVIPILSNTYESINKTIWRFIHTHTYICDMYNKTHNNTQYYKHFDTKKYRGSWQRGYIFYWSFGFQHLVQRLFKPQNIVGLLYFREDKFEKVYTNFKFCQSRAWISLKRVSVMLQSNYVV